MESFVTMRERERECSYTIFPIMESFVATSIQTTRPNVFYNASAKTDAPSLTACTLALILYITYWRSYSEFGCTTLHWWETWRKQSSWSQLLQCFTPIRIPVWTPECELPTTLQGLCDPLQKAYAAVVYLQVETNGTILNHFLCSKSKVAQVQWY